MAIRDDIRDGMQVLGSDGGMIGTVDGGAEGDQFKLKRDHAGAGAHHYLPLEWIDRVDDHVHLNVTAATARDRWESDGTTAAAGTAAAGAAGGLGSTFEGARDRVDAAVDDLGASARATGDRIERAIDDNPNTNWLPWILGALALLALLFFGLRGCSGQEPVTTPVDEAVVVDETVTTDANATGAAVVDDDGSILNRDVEAFLAGSDPTPKTFTFNGVKFDTGSAAVRAEDTAELASLAKILAARSTAKVDIVGYTDSTGNAAANAKLAMDRAKSVAGELAKGGVAKANITPRTGGEDAAAGGGSNQNARRTDLVITAR